MKKFTFLLFWIFIALPMATMADSSINLTPVPMKMTKGTGTLVFPQSFAISTGDLETKLAAEGARFGKLFGEISGYTVSVITEGDAFIKMYKYTGNEELGNEGYTLDITADGITIAANSANGFYYAFQSVKKMLPANVMAEVKDANITEYSLPVVSIIDAPRFEYRGFMLDVSRHYFSTDQIKRMIDVMSYYKMNRFHWHLTDDQGWRFEVKKYPRLTTVGATRSDSWSVDPEYGGYYINEPYGPYFYTQDECRDIVAYAAVSPYKFGATNTSYPYGFSAKSIQAASMILSLNAMFGYPFATSFAQFKNKPSVNFIMFALWMAVTFCFPIFSA